MLHLANLLVYIRQHWRDDALQRRVQWQERVLYVGMVEHSLQAVMESWRESEDPALLAPALLRLRTTQRAEF